MDKEYHKPLPKRCRQFMLGGIAISATSLIPIVVFPAYHRVAFGILLVGMIVSMAGVICSRSHR